MTPHTRPWSRRNASALTGRVTWRSISAGVRKVSADETWLLARITPPVRGMFSAPVMVAL